MNDPLTAATETETSSALRAPNSPLAIVGIGCLFPKAAGPGFFWANVKSGTDCITEIPPTHWDPDQYFDPDPKVADMTYARRGGFLSAVDFNPMEFGIAPRDIEATDTSQLLGLVAAKQALTDAGVILTSIETDGSVAATDPSPKAVDRNRVSVILGVTGTLELVIPLGARLGHPRWKQAMKDAGIPDDAAEDAAQRIADSYVPWQENSFPGLLGNVVAGRIANKLDLGGTNCVVDAACASSLSAVHLASLELQAGRADVVVTGGVDTFNDIFMFMCFSKTPALSPTGDAKPFDAAGDGTILGEGLGMVVLKRLTDAEQAGDIVYAVLRGIGSSSDGKGNAIYAPSSAGQKKCLQTAYALAGVTPDTIELVEAHGTGTKVGDTAEITALTEVFGREPTGGQAAKARPWCAIGSVKSQIGHTKAAAGAASLIKTTLALYNKVLPPTLKVTRPVEPLLATDSPFYANTRMRPWLPRAEHPRRAALSAFGFGGSNFHAVLEEYRPEKSEPDWDGSVEVVTLSADTPAELIGELEKLHPHPTQPFSWDNFARSAEGSRSTFRFDAPCRLGFAAHRTLTDLPKLLARTKTQLQSDPAAQTWHTPDGVHYTTGPTPGKVAILFPGQGSQYVGMLRELLCQFPETLDTLVTANTATASADVSTLRLSDRIYPPSRFDTEREAEDDRELRDTRHAQPAIGAVSFGAWRLLRDRFGVVADVFAGHSYGELVALAAAGWFAPADLFALSRVRGELMAQQRDGDTGSMLAVFAPLPEIDRVLKEQGLNLVLANTNAPNQAVLSGATADVERAEQTFSAAGLKSARLPVAAAFHSEFVADAAGPFRAALDGVHFAAPNALVFANTTADGYPTDPDAARNLLAKQLAKPVAFVDQIRAMTAVGVRTFVEVGPGSVLTRLVEAILADAGVTGAETFALDSSGGKRPGVLDLGNTIARLATRGVPVRITAWEAGSRCRPLGVARAGLIVPICGANHVNARPKRPQRPGLAGNAQGGAVGSVAAPHKNGLLGPPLPPAPAGRLPRPNAEIPPMSNTPDPGGLAQALLTTQQTLAAVQRMQDQTAQLHRQFLESQEAAQRTLQALVEQQRMLLLSSLNAGEMPIPVPPLPTVSESMAPRRHEPVAVPPFPTPPQPETLAPQREPVAAPPATRPVAPTAAQPHTVRPPAGRESAGLARGVVETTLLAVVSEKTGYPESSLDLGLSLDADLGVDSIKRVEILSALQERLPNAPQVKPEHLGTLHTLQDVATFLASSVAASATASTPPANTPADDEELTRTLQMNREQLLLLARPDGQPTPATPKVQVDVAGILLDVVSEKTGYPTVSLDLSLSLDSDLGVDSIKRVEILSALQERLPDAPQVKPEHLGTLRTLQDVADFLAGRSVPQPEAMQTAKIAHVPAIFSGNDTLAGASTTISRVDPLPVSTLRTPIDPASPSEFAAPKTKHVIDIPTPSDSFLRIAGIAPNQGEAPPPVGPANPPRAITHARLGGPIVSLDRLERSILQTVDMDPNTPRTRLPLSPGGEVWVVGEADDLTECVVEEFARQGFAARAMAWPGPGTTRPAGPVVGLVLLAPVAPGPDSGLNRLAFQWLQFTGPKLRQAGRQAAAVFATVARLDGAFGLNKLSPDADPTAGGLAGLAKTARWEWPEVSSKAVDLDPDLTDPATAAATLVDEILTTGPHEVGVGSTHRCTLELARTVRRMGGQPTVLGSKDVVLVTGGARGVTAEAAIALAETFTPTLILTGRTPTPGPEPEWLAGLTGEAGLKKVLAEHFGPDVGPRLIGEQYQKVITQREVRRTLQRIEQTGARVVYFPVDVADGKAVADLLQQVRVKFGPITAVVHGAGVLADKRIEDLAVDDFDRVYATKVSGLRNLLDMLSNEDLKALVLFSSITARGGRIGQVAYAVANEVLNKTAQVEARRRPGCRVVSINWGPWEGGMVTPGLRKQFETEGVGLIPLQDGAAFMVNELSAAGKAVEILAQCKPRASGSGVHPVPAGSGGAATSTGPGPTPALNPVPVADLTLAFERVLDIESHPVLRSHVIDGLAVVPMALHLEFLAHAALHGHPGLVFHGFNDLRITKGVKLDAEDGIALRVYAGKAVKQEKQFIVPVELRGKKKDGREVIHSRAEVVLVAATPKPPTADRPPIVSPYPLPVDQAYREYLFHGPDLRGIERVDGASEVAITGAATTAPPPADWFQYPLRSTWVADPLVLDASFQMMILWSRLQHGAASLPNYAGRYRQFRRHFPDGPVGVVIRVTRDNGTFARADIDYLDADGQVIAQMQDYECLIQENLNQKFGRNQLGAVQA
jgi:acyl transferase domain-containing protein/NAD(P)-dependent dehydrogenase (short-subunit alcohol dehydrogenase family)/acyl carrier protein